MVTVSAPKKKSEGRANQYAYPGLDRVIHERARLSVLTSLARYSKGLRFGDLKALCGLTDGNLSRHMQVLQEAGLIDVAKSFEHNRPQTTVQRHLAGKVKCERPPGTTLWCG